MMETQVLFHFKAESSNHVFLELKRPQFLKEQDISKYVSWFMVQLDNNPCLVTRLNFVSWENNVRTFEQGVLTSSDRDATFVVAATGDKITATAASCEEEGLMILVKACIGVWGE